MKETKAMNEPPTIEDQVAASSEQFSKLLEIGRAQAAKQFAEAINRKIVAAYLSTHEGECCSWPKHLERTDRSKTIEHTWPRFDPVIFFD